MAFYHNRKEKNTHHGRTIAKFRRTLGVAQGELAQRTGLSEETITRLEKTGQIAEETLSTIALCMNIPVELIRNYEEDPPLYFGQREFDIHDQGNNHQHYQPVFNYYSSPTEELIQLFHQLVSSEREKAGMLMKVNEVLLNVVLQSQSPKQ